MSIEAVRRFNEIAESDLDIQSRLEATTGVRSLIALTVGVASEIGFSFTADDLEQYYAQESRKVPDVSLRNVMFLTRSSNAIESEPKVCDRLPYLAREICLRLGY
ncbi:Nif11-like leader peptide family natural product precursor [Microcystis aeruginosa]|uniref:Nif11 domain-containing protein n=1 Tax=Microcystis aeruginosa PCC 9443 TaxID=1160281 RepID=I4G0C4_MICAE|nr:Nif11-like leader peptide family natural product precursor [Microcystis aeruginosa]CCI01385.1 conserved hypothetical protein [Microcystis aeruginosa PCC 9443]